MEGKEKGRKEAVETNVVHSGLFDIKNNNGIFVYTDSVFLDVIKINT